MMWQSLWCTYEGCTQVCLSVCCTESTNGTSICLFTGHGLFLEFEAQRWSGWTCCASHTCSCLSHWWYKTSGKYHCTWMSSSCLLLHPQHAAVRAKLLLDFLTFKKAPQPSKHHKLLTQQQTVRYQWPYILWTDVHWLKHYPIEVKLNDITLQGVLLENI
jgi:hypothetical protein